MEENHRNGRFAHTVPTTEQIGSKEAGKDQSGAAGSVVRGFDDMILEPGTAFRQ
jgi:hypothetical protein